MFAQATDGSDSAAGGALLAERRDCHRPRAGRVAVLAQVDALPRAKSQGAAAHGQRQRRPHQRRFDVCRNVARSLGGMPPVRALPHRLVAPRLEVLLTSEEAFSFSVSDADVCWMNT